MKFYLLECGHTLPYETIYNRNKDNRNINQCLNVNKDNVNSPYIICSKCGQTSIKCILQNCYDTLIGRYAKNAITKKLVKSRWDLPNFKWQPYEEYDYFK